jgi:hypothetical protein
MPAAAIFADTQDEPESVYRWLDWLEKQLPFPVHRVTSGKLSLRALEVKIMPDGRKYSKIEIPFFTLNADGTKGKIQNRACTRDSKIYPVQREYKKIAMVKRGEKNIRVIQWIGISLDEIYRMKESREPWLQSRWPLIENKISRHDCLEWMKKNGFPEPPRSACVYCPFHSNYHWRKLKSDEPKEFEKAVKFEVAIQKSREAQKHLKNLAATVFLHRSCKPLSEVDFSTEEDRGQLDMFNNECEGMCGV